MKGADRLVATLGELGVTHVFTNPGTTELELVRSLEASSSVTPVLVTQELVATGAADGFGRICGVGVALLHLGPGFSNGAAFVHDARRAGTPMLVIVGEHPKAHLDLDAPLNTDVVAIMGPFCVAVMKIDDGARVASVIGEAYACAQRLRGPVGVIAPQDVMMSEFGEAARAASPERRGTGDSCEDGSALNRARMTGDTAEAVIPSREQLGDDPVLLVGSMALSGVGLAYATKIASHLGARLYAEVFPALMERGNDTPCIPRLPYFPDQARALIGEPSAVVFIGAVEPLAYFAEVDRSASLIPRTTPRLHLAPPGVCVDGILSRWAKNLGCEGDGVDGLGVAESTPVPPLQFGSDERLNVDRLGFIFARAIQSGDVVVDEGRTSSASAYRYSALAPHHRYLGHPGGAIGGGLALALGAAVATRARVRALVADGGALYAPQALWTMARLGLPVGVVIAANDGYRILRLEMQARGIEPVSDELTRFAAPTVDYVALAAAFGVEGFRARTVGELDAILGAQRDRNDPFLVVAELVD